MEQLLNELLLLILKIFPYFPSESIQKVKQKGLFLLFHH